MRRAVTVMAIALLVLGGCGSDDDDDAGSPGTTAGAPSDGADAPVELEGDVNAAGTSDATGAEGLDLALEDFAFGPTYVKVTSGQQLTVALSNEGEAPHTFTIDAIGVDQTVQPGASASVDLALPATEAVAFYCKFHKGGGMQGAFYVTEGASVGQPGVTSGGSGAAGY